MMRASFRLLVPLLISCSVAFATEEARVENVLFIISDDLKANVLGCYGDAVAETPNIDRLAQQGMVFERAYCQGVTCAPSRLSLMFSRYRGEGAVNLGQHFRENDVYTARVGKIYHMRVPGDIIMATNGRDFANSWTERFNSSGAEAHTLGEYACLNLDIFTRAMRGRETTRMDHRMFVSVVADDDGATQPDYKTASKTVELLRAHKDARFFLAAGMVRPHYPMVAPKEFFDPFPWEAITLPEAVENDLADIPEAGHSRHMSSNNPIGEYPDNQKRMWSAYYAATKFMDAQVGRILDEVNRLGLRESTAIVFTSDHGYHLGEHGFWEKANLHEEVTRVPLIISVPGMKPGRTDALVELVDLFPTLADLAGLSIPDSAQGASLIPILENPEANVRDSALSLHDGYALRTADWAYMRYDDGSEELYDMQNDPKQFTNLVEHPDFSTQRTRMREMLEARLGEAGQP